MSDGKLRQIFREHLPHFHWQAIESGFTGRGIPDANYCYNGVEGWVENKRTTSWKVGISPEQVGWHMRRHRAGGLTFIAVRRQNKTIKKGAVDELWLYPGCDIESLRDNGLLDTFPMLKFIDGPRHWDWERIGTYLIRGD